MLTPSHHIAYLHKLAEDESNGCTIQPQAGEVDEAVEENRGQECGGSGCVHPRGDDALGLEVLPEALRG